MATTFETPTCIRQIAAETEVELQRARLAAMLMGKPLLVYVLDMALQEMREGGEGKAAMKRPTST